MLVKIAPKPEAKAARNLRKERKHWHKDEFGSVPLGCPTCPHFGLCGGLQVETPIMDCLSYCCGKPESCDKVCLNNTKDFYKRVREVGDFPLNNIPRSLALRAPPLENTVPIIYHRNSRVSAVTLPSACIPFYKTFNRNGTLRFRTYEEMCAGFGLQPGVRLILTGTDRDVPLERWWGLGAPTRKYIIKALKAAGVSMVTTPNYSLFSDVPRWDDMHAIKRIAITFNEFVENGMPAALHVNGRTDKDFERWGVFLAERPEVTHISYEFGTGAGWVTRQAQHVEWLIGLAKAANRPLNLILRGGTDALPALRSVFKQVTLLDSTPFLKTLHRQRAVPTPMGMKWQPAPTLPDEPVDDLFEMNLALTILK